MKSTNAKVMKMRADANTSVLWKTNFGKHLVISGKVEYLHTLQASKYSSAVHNSNNLAGGKHRSINRKGL